MNGLLKFVCGAAMSAIMLVGFFWFVAWGESPATWEPVSRFMAAVVVIVFSAGAGAVAYGYED